MSSFETYKCLCESLAHFLNGLLLLSLVQLSPSHIWNVNSIIKHGTHNDFLPCYFTCCCLHSVLSFAVQNLFSLLTRNALLFSVSLYIVSVVSSQPLLNNTEFGWGYSSAIECLPSMTETWDSILSATKVYIF